jgi:hypothetical protein
MTMAVAALLRDRFTAALRVGCPAGVLLLLTALAGCGESDASRNARLTTSMNQALELLDQAHQGYVAPDALGDPDRDRAAWVQDKYRQAIDHLRPVMTDGARAQQFGAAQLLTQLQVARASYTARQAGARWAGMSNQAATVMTQLMAVHRAADLVFRLSGDESTLQGELAGVGRQLDFQLDTLRQRAADLGNRIDANQARRDELTRRRDDLMAQAADLEQQAFTAAQDQGYDLQLQAIELRRQAEQYVGQIERLAVQRDGLDSELAIVAAQITHLDALAGDVSDEIDHSSRRDAAIEQARGQALTVYTDAVEELVAAFSALARAFNDEVAGPFEGAAFHAESAVAAADQAVRAADTRGRQDARLGLLSAKVAAADVHTRYVMVLGSFGQITAVVRDRAQQPAGERGQFFVENHQRIARQQAELIAAVTDRIVEALELAAQLGADDPDAEAAAQTRRLQEYLRQLEAARLAV